MTLLSWEVLSACGSSKSFQMSHREVGRRRCCDGLCVLALRSCSCPCFSTSQTLSCPWTTALARRASCALRACLPAAFRSRSLRTLLTGRLLWDPAAALTAEGCSMGFLALTDSASWDLIYYIEQNLICLQSKSRLFQLFIQMLQLQMLQLLFQLLLMKQIKLICQAFCGTPMSPSVGHSRDGHFVSTRHSCSITCTETTI